MYYSFIIKHIYTLENIDKLYLSPYCDYTATDDHVTVWRNDTTKKVTLSMLPTETLIDLINKLRVGMSKKELLSALEEYIGVDLAEQWIAFSIQRGIIE